MYYSAATLSSFFLNVSSGKILFYKLLLWKHVPYSHFAKFRFSQLRLACSRKSWDPIWFLIYPRFCLLEVSSTVSYYMSLTIQIVMKIVLFTSALVRHALFSYAISNPYYSSPGFLLMFNLLFLYLFTFLFTPFFCACLMSFSFKCLCDIWQNLQWYVCFLALRII